MRLWPWRGKDKPANVQNESPSKKDAPSIDTRTPEQKRADEILAKGNPVNWSLEEYLLIFPGACSRCGCRLIRIDTVIGDSSESSLYPTNYGAGGYETYACTRCNAIWGDGGDNASGYYFRPGPSYDHLVSSPYVGTTGIPDYPYNPK